MHVLHILNHVLEAGNGIVNVAVDLACLQAQAGCKVGVASAGGGYEKLLMQHGVKHFKLDQTRKPIELIEAARGYRAIVKEFDPNIVHAHMMTGVVLASTLRFQSQYALVSTVHNEFQRSAVLMGLADRVIAVSKAVADSMVRRGIPEQKLRVISNGTLGSPRTCQLKECVPVTLKHPAIVTVAGMYKRKGIAELVAAFAQIAADFPTAHLYLVGDGPDRELFEAQARNTPVSDRIHFERFQPQPQRYLMAADIFVLASHRDPSPLVIPEAREAGCAIVATHVDGIPEALDGGKAGILVPAADSHALAAALTELLNEPPILHAWKDKARQNIERLTATRVHQETLAVYDELAMREDS